MDKKTLYDLIDRKKIEGSNGKFGALINQTVNSLASPDTIQAENQPVIDGSTKELNTYNPAPQMDADAPKPTGPQQTNPQMTADDFYNIIKANTSGGGIAGALSGAVNPGYADMAKNYLGQIENRQPFNLNLNENAMYQMYRDLYMRNGQQAMKNTMGQASGLTGGFGSSYAQAVGNQAYNDYLTKLNQVVPDLYDRERAAYDKETQDLYNRYNIYSDLENQNYNREMAEQSRQDDLAWREWQKQQSELDRQEANEKWKWQQEEADKDRAEAQENAAWNREWQQKQWDAEQANDTWSKSQSERKDAYDRVMTMLQYNITPSADLLEKAGLTMEEANQIKAYLQYQANIGTTGGGRGSGGRSGGRSGRGYSTDETDGYDAELSNLASNTAYAGASAAYDALTGRTSQYAQGVPQDEYSAIKYNIQKMKADGASIETILAWLQKYGRVNDAQYNELLKFIVG